MTDFIQYEDREGKRVSLPLPNACYGCAHHARHFCTGLTQATLGRCPKWIPLLERQLASLPKLPSEVWRGDEIARMIEASE